MAKLDDLKHVRDLGERGLVKIDVEGGERAVFFGMQETLKTHRPDILLETFDSKNCDYINRLIKPLGYRVFLVRENGALEPLPELITADNKSGDLNQLLTVAPI